MRRLAVTIGCTGMMWICSAGLVAACEGHTYVRAILDPVPAQLGAVRIELSANVPRQIMLENNSGRSIEVLDEVGDAFLRIGPDAVEGNADSAAWYRAQGSGVVSAQRSTDRAPRWTRSTGEPRCAWLDSRLDPARAILPADVLTQANAADVGEWKIPLSVDGQRIAITGRFKYEPPQGAYIARLTTPSEIRAGVRVTLLPGSRPGLLVQNNSERVVTVYGEHGEPFLRIAPGGVEANLHSATWWRSGRSAHAHGARIDERAPPQWERIARSPRFSWIDPRADDAKHSWTIPLQIGDEPATISGVAAWRAF